MHGMKWLLSYAEAAAAGPAAAGGKGWNLGRLALYGFPVPPGFVVGADAYRAFVAANGLQAAIDALAGVPADRADHPDTVARLEQLRAAMAGARAPDGLDREVAHRLAEPDLVHRPLAVRSSATAEDSTRASFAGIHRSFLNVRGLDDVLDKLRLCYASLWTPQALAYRRRAGLSDADVSQAVVVCRLVHAAGAGVAFSADPVTGRRDRVVIAANLGLGESVVMGSAESDRYVVAITNTSQARLIDGHVGRKQHRVVAHDVESGTRTEELGDVERSQPVLGTHQVQRLALLVQRIQDALGESHRPQDVEWCFDGLHFVITQARPITALPWPTFAALGGQALIWSNANMKDAYPGVQSPFSWWLNSATHEIMARRLLGWAGYPMPEGQTWSRLYHGRLYLNLSAVQYAVWDAFGIPPAETNGALGGHQPVIQLPEAGGPERRRRMQRLWRLGREMRRAVRRARAAFDRVDAWAAKQEAQDFDSLADGELVHKLWQLERERREILPETMIHNANSLWASRLRARLEAAFPGRGGALTSALLAGTGGVVSAEPGYRLLGIARLATHEPAARDFFAAETLDADRWRERLLGTRTLEQIHKFLREFGYRGIYEMEVMNPRWVEEPAWLLEVIRQHIREGTTAADPLRAAAERRRAAEREVAARLVWRPHRLLEYRWLLGKAREGMRLREGAKAALVRLLWPMRRWGLSVGRRLVRRKLLDQPADAFLFSGHELVALLSQEWDGTGMQAMAAERRRRRAELEAMDPPDVIIGEQPQPRAAAAAPAGGRGPADLAGLGVAAGVATGPARIIRHPAEGTRLRRGDVLVAPSTDPAWTPMFLRAAAVVMEVGGYLSHGAIVAREYGIPAVANAPGATTLLDEGSTVTVDGDRGLVFSARPLPGAQGPPPRHLSAPPGAVKGRAR